MPREAFWAGSSQSSRGIHELQPISTCLIPEYRPRRPFLPTPFPVPVDAAVAAAALRADLRLWTAPLWRSWVSSVSFTENESLRCCVSTPRRPPAQFHLATGEGGIGAARPPSGLRRPRPIAPGTVGESSLSGGCGWSRTPVAEVGRGEGTPRRRCARRRGAGRAARVPAAAAPPPPSANEWPVGTTCYVAVLRDTPSSDVVFLVRVVWRRFPLNLDFEATPGLHDP